MARDLLCTTDGIEKGLKQPCGAPVLSENEEAFREPFWLIVADS